VRRAIATAAAMLATGSMILTLFASAAAGRTPPHIKHTFIVVLENENAAVTFGPRSPAPYLAKRLSAKGEFLPNYYAVAHNSNPNYLAMISGQAPNPQTQLDCQLYDDFVPGVPAGDGQVLGTGCVYPPGVETVANQLEDSGYSWRGYMEDMKTPCRHPALNALDHTQSAHPGDQYAARHNPFVYFHSLTDFPTCARNVLDLSYLRKHLRHERRTPNYSFIVPDLCNDGHDSPCVDGRPGGLVSANRWLRRWVPRILRSPAFGHRGLLIVTFDEADATGGDADSSACCAEKPGPNLVFPATPGAQSPGPGGGRIGAVLVSPCIKPGSVVDAPYNHYSLLRWIENNFGLPHLGYAGQRGLHTFRANVLNRPRCGRRA
jgi:phosphatidylinositol-3-phosphatase